MRDLYSNLKVSHVLSPAVRTSVSATTVDRRGYDSLAFLISIGACTDGSFQFKLTESDSENSDYTDVAAADQEGTIPLVSNDESPDAYSRANSSFRVGYKGTKRYVKLAATVTGSPGTGIACGATAVLANGHVKPEA